MTRILFLTWIMALATASAAAAAECRHEARPEGTLYHHPTGFALMAAPALRVDCREDGMRVTDPAQPERTSGAAFVRIVSDAPPGPWLDVYVPDGGEPIPFRVERLNGGSGGTEYVVSAWQSLPATDRRRSLLVEQHRQFEFQAPGRQAWSLVWTVLSNIQPSPGEGGE